MKINPSSLCSLTPRKLQKKEPADSILQAKRFMRWSSRSSSSASPKKNEPRFSEAWLEMNSLFFLSF
jgi:hypothetical protein